MGLLNGFLRQTGDELAVDVLTRELQSSIADRNTAKSRALRLISETQTLLRRYDGSKDEWTDTALDKELESSVNELVKQIHTMLTLSESANRLVEEDDILRQELEKPIQRTF